MSPESARLSRCARTKHLALCSIHFEESYFENDLDDRKPTAMFNHRYVQFVEPFALIDQWAVPTAIVDVDVVVG